MSEVYTPFEQRIVDGYLKATYPDEPAAPDLQEAATMMTLPEDAKNIPLSTFGKMAMDVPAGLAKGAVQGTIGLPGDLISLGRGLAAAASPNPGEGRLDAFLRGTKGATILPTTEDVKKFLDETLGVPLVPAGETDQIRRESAGVTETVGELFGGGKTALGLSKATAQAGAAIGRELAPKAGEMAEDLLRKQGLLLDVAPKNKSSETVRLYHGGNPGLEEIKGGVGPGNIFGGVFGSQDRRVAASHGDGSVYRMDVPKGAILSQQMLDSMDHLELTGVLKKAMPWLKKKDIDEAFVAVIEDKAHKIGDDSLMRIFREDSPGEAGWEAQRIRGEVARLLGKKAVEMADEHGVCYLVLPGVKPILDVE
jgi:hypothetical protein